MNRILVALLVGGSTAFAQSTLESIAHNMVLVEGGSFTMGCPMAEYFAGEIPTHRVALKSFYISKYEVTQAQYQEVMGSNPSKFQGCAECPVEEVSWNDAQAFIRKLNGMTGRSYRLPTEAEWEFAARGGKKSRGTKYSGGNDIGKVGWHKANSSLRTHPVGLRLPNELGIYDMSGNVNEWCNDWYSDLYYELSPTDNPKGPERGESRVYRGGSYVSYWLKEVNEDFDCRVCARSSRASTIGWNTGIRLAHDL